MAKDQVASEGVCFTDMCCRKTLSFLDGSHTHYRLSLYDQLDETSKNRVKSICKKYADKLNNTNQDKNLRHLDNVKIAKQESVKDDVRRFSLTDPESRFIKNKKGRIELGCNTQITVDHKEGIIIANDVCQQRSDAHQLKPQLELVEKYCGRLGKGTKICADSGYIHEINVQYLKQKDLDPYIPEQSDKDNIKKVRKHKK
ncbi:transposase [Methanohalobium evestigatum]|uniref:transposase n=1 Tax=Methanohalobium evestigatum TaxID=2322 RepID=UPI000677E5A7|nr:transposase [Methanohalobium evestigatum]